LLRCGWSNGAHLKTLLEKIIPLKPVEQRSEIPNFLAGKTLYADNDADYLCFSLSMFLLKAGFTIVFLMLLDLKFKTGLLVNLYAVETNKYLFAVKLRDFIQWIELPAIVLFYLRIRLFLDMRKDHVPVILNTRFYSKNLSKKKWILLGLIVVAISCITLFAPPVLIKNVGHYFHKENDLSFLLIPMIVQIMAYSGAGIFFLSALLYIEKVIRFFPEFRQDCRAMASRLLNS
jgi:hypothetical protein